METKTLYGVDKNGGAKIWKVWTEGATIFVQHGKLGGKQQVKETVCKGKNQGRANETSPEQQAVLEAESKYRKQLDKYYKPTLEEAQVATTEGVMLAHDYLKQGHRIDDNFWASRKLDGLRLKSELVNGEIVLHSRGGKTYPVPPHLEDQLKTLHESSGLSQLDGEFYIHDTPLQKIVSAAKKHNELTPKLEYHIFDVPLENTIWVKRKEVLENLDVSTLSHIFLVENEFASKDALEELQAKYRSEGFEGVMLRNECGMYEFQNKRSADLQKYKLFMDSEAKVVGCREDKNAEGVLSCEWKGVTFDCKMKGSHNFRKFEVQQGLIGQWINFSYQDTSIDGVPIFPVGQYVRKCDPEGNPVE